MPAKSRKQQKLLFAKFGELIVLWFVIFAVFFYLVSVMVDRWGPM
jgi:hypothetical protein